MRFFMRTKLVSWLSFTWAIQVGTELHGGFNAKFLHAYVFFVYIKLVWRLNFTGILEVATEFHRSFKSEFPHACIFSRVHVIRSRSTGGLEPRVLRNFRIYLLSFVFRFQQKSVLSVTITSTINFGNCFRMSVPIFTVWLRTLFDTQPFIITNWK